MIIIRPERYLREDWNLILNASVFIMVIDYSFVDNGLIELCTGAALLEAKLGNIEGLAELHKQCKRNFSAKDSEFSNDIIARIGALEHAVKGEEGEVGLGRHMLKDDNELHGYGLGER